jgi:hypothetical protein
MSRPVILTTPEQLRAPDEAPDEADRIRRGSSRLLLPETRHSPDCAPASR